MNPNIANIVMKEYLAINVNIAIPKIIKIIVNIMLIYISLYYLVKITLDMSRFTLVTLVFQTYNFMV